MRRSPIRVLAFIDTIQISGPGRQLASSVAELDRRGVQLRIVLFRRAGEPVRPYEAFLRERGSDVRVLVERFPFDPSVVRQASAEVTAFQPHLVQTHGYKPSSVAFALRALGVRCPWLAFYHGHTTENLKVRAYHALDQLLMRTADLVVVMSAAHHRLLHGRVRALEVVHNAVLFDVPSAQATCTDDRPPKIVVVGRLSPEKGVDVLLEACALLRSAGTRFTLTVVGDGPERASLEALVVARQLSDVVHFDGHQPDPRPYYADSDLLVIPSRSEGLPNVLLEAIAYDLPVVATRVGAVPEVLTDATVGLICPPGDAEALSRCISLALPATYRTDGRAGRRAVLDLFSLQRRGERLSTLCGRLATGAAT